MCIGADCQTKSVGLRGASKISVLRGLEGSVRVSVVEFILVRTLHCTFKTTMVEVEK